MGGRISKGNARPGWRAGGKRAHGGARGTPRGVPRAGGRRGGLTGAASGSQLGVRGGAGRGGSTGSPRWVGMVAITRGSAMVANNRSRPPQSGHASTSRPKEHLSYCTSRSGCAHVVG